MGKCTVMSSIECASKQFIVCYRQTFSARCEPSANLGCFMNNCVSHCSLQLPAFDSVTISPVVSWVVEYGRESSSDAMKDVLGNVTSLLIPELEKGVDYTAKVAGRNERRSGVVQLGVFSNTATNQTDVDRKSMWICGMDVRMCGIY